MTTEPPILYSFRRCPYAMRARLAIHSSEVSAQLREIVLSDKAAEFLTSSPKGTVPVIVVNNRVIDESLDIMHWALNKSDPEGWLNMPSIGYNWISLNDREFKSAMDRIKYTDRFSNVNIGLERRNAIGFLHDLNTQIGDHAWMFGKNCSLADMAILPFVRQFYNIDQDWFYAQDWQNLYRWLTSFMTSSRLGSIMTKYDKWIPGNTEVSFPPNSKLFSTQGFTK